MYDQSIKFQSGVPSRGGEGGTTTDRPSEGMPHLKLVTDGNGRVWPVDENGKPLGIYTDNSANRTTQGFQTIREKFKLLHFARKLLPKERTAHCFYNRIAKEEGVSVFLNKLRNKANYGNVMRCANPWACPVCSAIISEGRKDEVKTAMDWWKAQGGDVLLLTLTAPHYSTTDIKSLKPAMLKARKYMLKGVRATKDLFKHYAIEHYISVFEVTHGKNGFHPHFHILLFTKYHVHNPRGSVMRMQFFEQWKKACEKAGLDQPSYEHGLDLRNGQKAASYVSKWGLEHEMTKGHIKKGKTDSKTPFDLLRDYAEGDENAGKLFRIYFDAFKGTRQLNWSKGLKKLSSKGKEEKTDQELVDETDNVAELMFKLSIELWHPIRKHGRQGELLIKVQEDHTLKKAMEYVKECLGYDGQLRE